MSLSVNLPEILKKVARALASVGGRAVLVGGSVRDSVLGIPVTDFDVEVFGMASYDDLVRTLAAFGKVNLVGAFFSVVKMKMDGVEIDFSLPRRERKTGKKHVDFEVEADGDMFFEEAASRRDFTINAMGFVIETGEFLDPFGGWADLEKRVLRHVGPRFSEDPLRVFRAMQFAARFELDIVPETVALCRSLSLEEISNDRKWAETRKMILFSKKPALGLFAAEKLGIVRLANYPDNVLDMLVAHFGMPPSIARKVTLSKKPKPIILGRELQILGVKAGPEMGALLKQIYAAQMAGEFYTIEEGRAWIKQHLSL
ncbi:MAG: CCA tRNA nucleotidyltransferase [Candidatus Margulisbacteria bacterium]|nr:CCA tRNA nucleotidyltransferase [Candidatus Margulisiibacteriota bacterium]